VKLGTIAILVFWAFIGEAAGRLGSQSEAFLMDLGDCGDAASFAPPQACALPPKCADTGWKELMGERSTISQVDLPSLTTCPDIRRDWLDLSGTLHSLTQIAELPFTVNLPEEGLYALAISVRQSSPLGSLTETILDLSLGELWLGRGSVWVSPRESDEVLFFLPHLPAGDHQFTLNQIMEEYNRWIAIGYIHLVDFAGEDWKAARRESVSGRLRIPESSHVSPVCVEGCARWVERMLLVAGQGDAAENVDVIRGIGYGWYADVPLSPSGSTPVTVADVESGFSWTGEVTWQPWDLSTSHPALYQVRAGDSMLFTAPAPVSIQVNGEPRPNPQPGEPLAIHFEQGGTYLIDGSWQEEGVTRTGFLRVRCVSGAFGPNTALWINRWKSMRRQWACPDLPAGVVVERDADLSLVERLPAPAKGRAFNIETTVQRPHVVVGRLGANGPILCRTVIESFNLLSTNQTAITVQQYPLYDGSSVVANAIVSQDLPEGAYVRLRVLPAAVGLTFRNGAHEWWISREDMVNQHTAVVHFIYLPNSPTSICHTLEIWQGGEFIGLR